jgi:HEAT repeat protein
MMSVLLKREEKEKNLSEEEKERLQKEREKEQEKRQKDEFAYLLNKPNKNLILLGDPGSGKTTYMLFFVAYYAGAQWAKDLSIPPEDAKQRIPILIPVQSIEPTLSRRNIIGHRELRSAAIRSMEDVLGQGSPETTGILYDNWAEDSSKEIVFLFDGLDQTDFNPFDVMKAIEKFANGVTGTKSKIILSSRMVSFEKFPNGFEVFILEPLYKPKEREKFLAKWLAALGNKQPVEEAVTLLKELYSHSALSSILDNPLSLQMIAETYHHKKAIPTNRADIYENYFYRIAEQRQIDSTQRKKAKTTLMAIAWRIHTSGQRDKDSLLEAIKKDAKVDDAKDLFALVYDKLNIISEQNNGFEFHHPTIQDYFVAERLKEAWINNSKATWIFIRPRLHLPKWKEPLSLLVAGLDEKNKDNFIAKVKTARSRYENKLHRDYFLAAKYIGENGLDEADVADSYFNLTRYQFNLKRRLALAIEALGYIGGEWAVRRIYNAYSYWGLREIASEAVVKLDEKSLLKFLESLKQNGLLHDLEWNIIFRLGEIGSPEAIEALSQVIERRFDTAGMTRWQAVSALGQIHDPETLTLIVQALNALIDDEVGDVIDVLAPETFVKFDGNKSVDVFSRILKDESENKPYPNIRRLIIKRLGEIGSKGVVPDLLDLMKNDSDIWIRIAAVKALGLFDDGQVVPRIVTELREALYLKGSQFSNGDQISLGRAKVETLEKLSIHLNPSILLEQARNDDDSRMQEVAFKALGNLGEKDVVPELIEIFQDDNFPYKNLYYEVAFIALGKLRDNRAVDFLLEMLDSNSRHIQEIIRALGEIGDEKAVPSLIAIVNNENMNEYTRQQAIESLGEIGGLEATNALIETIHTDKEENRGLTLSALDALGEVADRETTDIVISMLQHEDQRVDFIGDEKITLYSHYQSHAAEALGRIGDPKPIPALITALANRYPDASWKSAVALGEIFNKQPDPEKVKADALPALLDVIEKADKNFNWGALQFLGPIGDEGDKRTIRVLHKLVGKEYWHGGGWGRDTLGRIGGLESISVLMKANAKDEIISILERWHSKLDNSNDKEQKKNKRIIRSVALKIKTWMAANKFLALFAKLVLKFKRNPSWYYERWDYTSLDDTKLITLLAEIMDDLASPRFDPLQAPSRPLWQLVALLCLISGLIGVLTKILNDPVSLLWAFIIGIILTLLALVAPSIYDKIYKNREKD